jgi:hypothetical protein
MPTLTPRVANGFRMLLGMTQGKSRDDAHLIAEMWDFVDEACPVPVVDLAAAVAAGEPAVASEESDQEVPADA